MRTPEFTEEIPDTCDCAGCARGTTAVKAAARRRCTLRGAVVAAVGATLLMGTGVGAASAEPAPARAGWDGSKYWYKDATGWWRWTSHYSKYVANGGSSSASKPSSGSSASSSSSSSSSSVRTSEPTFRGRAGWDSTDRVYWYKDGTGWWRWTSHQDKYERYAGGSGSSSGSGSSGGSSSSSGTGSGTGTPVRQGTEGAISFANSHLGDNYVWGGNGPHGWDCSGLVQAAYRSAGIYLPRVASDQYRATTPISRSELRRGDLVFWTSNGSASGIHHVAIYLGDGKYLEAPRPGKQVRISSFSAYNPNMYGRVR
ncbi:C40 family peptidase [Streptomyces sp. NBC_00503]|uniref:C40 family peptidase n=1 Tax=Streptomyces sp. NBC_00503 TaxID=2903659 RepID=UPI002E809C96|nr:C40 family peptidase [Streptomyces sp. NBC_00503]WUD79920.1 C40 family peptidase [Streptomyces sp. NBC_00503]